MQPLPAAAQSREAGIATRRTELDRRGELPARDKTKPDLLLRGGPEAARQAFLPVPPPAKWAADEDLMERLGPHFDVVVWTSASSNGAGRRHAWAADSHGTLT